MWSPRGISRRGAVLALLALGACGFTPAYGPGGIGRALDGQVAVSASETLLGARLRQRLVQRLGSGGTRYQLTIDATAAEVAAAVTATGAQARISLASRATYRLTDGDRVLAEGVVTETAGFTTTGNSLAVRAAAADAEARLAVLLADRIMTRLLALPPPGP